MSEEKYDFAAMQREMLEEAMEIKRFHTVDGETIMHKQMQPLEYAVAEILPQGLTLLAGGSKTGKSLLTLNLCIAVSKGEPFLGFPTKRGTVLYLALEDTEARIQRRAMLMTDDMPSNFHYTNEALKVTDGLIEALEQFVLEHPDTVLIAIDVLELIRPDETSGNQYRDDYLAMMALHKFTQDHPVTLLIVHHTRKETKGDEFDAVSGTKALVGAADNLMLLTRPKRAERKGLLYCSGREMEDRYIELLLDDNCCWQINDDTKYIPEEINETVRSVYLYLMYHADLQQDKQNGNLRIYYEITATALSEALQKELAIEIPSNMITKNLTLYHHQLEYLGLRFENKRNRKTRLLIFDVIIERLRRLIAKENQLPEEVLDLLEAEDDDTSDGMTADEMVRVCCHRRGERKAENTEVTADSQSATTCHAVTSA